MNSAPIRSAKSCFFDMDSMHEFDRSLIDRLPKVEFINYADVVPEFLDWVPIAFARRWNVLAVRTNQEDIAIVIGEIESLRVIDCLRRILCRPTRLMLAPIAELRCAIDRAYQPTEDRACEVVGQLADSGNSHADSVRMDDPDLLERDDAGPVVELVNALLVDAARTRASDIHIQPYSDRVVARFRIDGVLFDQLTLPLHTREEVASRIKIMARMNIAEKRLPQDGRASVRIGPRRLDLRIASLPTSHGERLVIRLLDKSQSRFTLDELGINDNLIASIRSHLQRDHGMILVTGPTGGGKTTTLYAMLQETDRVGTNIVTLEDPIEYALEGISQSQINEKKGLTFAVGLRSLLRQDPDIIMVGEIRDRETADMAIQSALTGHLVLSTLHTNDAAGAVTRLLDLGVESYLVASSVNAVMAQRLVRRVCGCSTATGELNSSCPTCRGCGYSGRIGLFEWMVIDESMRDQIVAGVTASGLRTSAVKRGMRRLRDDGNDKAAVGLTTQTEVHRAAPAEDE